MMDVSFLMATRRPWERHGKVIVDMTREIVAGSRLIHEFVVCSRQYERRRRSTVDDVVQVPEPQGNDGSILPFNLAFRVSVGRIVYVLSDDCFPGDNLLDAVETLERMDRRYRVVFLGLSPEHRNNLIGGRMLPAMGYPVFARETVEKELGGVVFNPSFRHHYADNWLPYFLAESGEEPVGVETRPVHLQPQTVSHNDWHDKAVLDRLVSRYHEKYDDLVEVASYPTFRHMGRVGTPEEMAALRVEWERQRGSTGKPLAARNAPQDRRKSSQPPKRR